MGQIVDRLKRQRGGQVETSRRDDKGFRARLDAAAEAKKALLEKFRAQAEADDAARAAPDADAKAAQAEPKKKR